jgi:thiamine transport system permease protein
MQRLNLPVAGLLTVIQLVFTLAITWLYNRVKQPKYGKAATSGEAQNLNKPRNHSEKVLVIIVALLIVCLMALPLLSLVSRSVVTLDAARGERGLVRTGFTLRYYQELFVNRTGSLFYVPPFLAIRNSLTYSALAMLISTVIGLLSAYALVRTSRFNNLAEPFIMLPLGTSSVTLGLGFLIVFNRPPWNSPSFPLLIPIAHAVCLVRTDAGCSSRWTYRSCFAPSWSAWFLLLPSRLASSERQRFWLRHNSQRFLSQSIVSFHNQVR